MSYANVGFSCVTGTSFLSALRQDRHSAKPSNLRNPTAHYQINCLLGDPDIDFSPQDGCRHWVLMDEAHHLVPAERDVGATAYAGLRDRLYETVGFQEALRRLTKVFPTGSAQKEVERRRSERLRGGEMEAHATQSVVEG